MTGLQAVTSVQVLAKVGGKRIRWDMNQQFGGVGKITANSQVCAAGPYSYCYVQNIHIQQKEHRVKKLPHHHVSRPSVRITTYVITRSINCPTELCNASFGLLSKKMVGKRKEGAFPSVFSKFTAAKGGLGRLC